jgi:hypothetical protein
MNKTFNNTKNRYSCNYYRMLMKIKRKKNSNMIRIISIIININMMISNK